MKHSLTFYKGDKVMLINGRTAKVISRCKDNTYYYIVESYDNLGIKHKYKVFNLDMRLIKRKEETTKHTTVIIIDGINFEW